MLFRSVALVVLSEGKPLEDIERKCIVKYLSDRELLNSSFEVEAVNPEICDELLNKKITEIYEEIIHDATNERAQFHNRYTMKTRGTVDLVLKSLLYGNSTEAEELMKTLETFKKLVILSFEHDKLQELTKSTMSFELHDEHSAKNLCLKSFF